MGSLQVLNRVAVSCLKGLTLLKAVTAAMACSITAFATATKTHHVNPFAVVSTPAVCCPSIYHTGNLLQLVVDKPLAVPKFIAKYRHLEVHGTAIMHSTH